jgi:hypothetical protein
MSTITAAFSGLYKAQGASVDAQYEATVAGTTARCVASEINLDEILVPGGTANRGGWLLQMFRSDFAEIPPKFSDVTFQGRSLKVASVNENNGVLYVTAYDPASRI